MMGTMGASMAGSMAGSMLGNALMGGMGRGGEAPAPAQEGYASQPMYAQPQAAACNFETRSFLECMAQSNDNMDACRHIYDSFKLCQIQAVAQQQQQYA